MIKAQAPYKGFGFSFAHEEESKMRRPPSSTGRLLLTATSVSIILGPVLVYFSYLHPHT